jgi:hypothetical protein
MIQENKYKKFNPEQLEELFSNYLLDSWSFSKVSAFARNEKAFEMQYIYRQPYKSSFSSVAGSAYHAAIEFYFASLKNGMKEDLPTLQTVAYNYIDEIGANDWKIQKTTPSVDECKIKATETVTKLLNNFFSEIQVYVSEIKEIIDIEVYCNEWLTINGVDIPLPCHGQIDLIIKTTDDKIVIIDHKSKSVFSDEKEMKFSIGKQAITYVNLYESKTGLEINEVWFIENKISANKDKSSQVVPFKITIDKDTRRLYEAMLYEPLKRMIEAVSNPDYVYLINENDNFVDKAEIYEFWAQTMIAEISAFNILESKKEMITKRLKKVKDSTLAVIDPSIIRKFRENASEFIQYDLTNKDMTKEEKIEHVLRTLGILVKVTHTFNGYSSNTFLLEASAGINLGSIQKYKLDIACALNVPSIRILKDLFVHDGKSYLAVEATKVRDIDLEYDPSFLTGDMIPLGIDNFGKKITWNINNPSTPHILVCGSTGSGKSVFLTSTIEYCKLAGFNHIVIFDPKHEFKYYSNIASVFNDIEEIEQFMEMLVKEMNELVKSGKTQNTLIVFDEFADAVANSKKGNELNVYENIRVGTKRDGSPKYERQVREVKKSLEENLRILLQKGRSSGYRIIAATQRASVKVITGDAKVNFPVQVCFKVPKEIDSKVILDETGAESLAGKGDGLIKSPDYPGTIRFQAIYKK